MAAAEKKKVNLYYLHVAIGFGLMILFFFLPPLDPITPLGMKVVGVFLMMIYCWSTVDTMWPSILGILMLAALGLGGEGGANAVWMTSVGNNTVLLVLFALILFGAVDHVGDTSYIARFFLTRNIFKGRPIIFMAVFFITCSVLSAFTNVFIALILMWPIATRTMEIMDISKEDRVWKFFFVGMFLAITLAQPLLPFKGAPLIPLSAFESMTAAAGNPLSVPYLPYMLTNIIMTSIVMTIYLLGIKFVLRVDLSKMRSVDPEMVGQQFQLPPMNTVQKIFLWMIPAFLLLLLVPGFVSGNPVCDFLNYIGPLGVTAGFVVLFLTIRIDDKPLLDFKEVAYKHFNWGIFFMIAAAVYAAGLLSSDAVGFSAWLIQVLNPVFGGQPELVFVGLMLLVALIITNFANNAAMAVVLLPIVIGFSEQMGIDPTPVAMGVVLMVFVAMLTPAASPHASMMHGNKALYTTKDIMSIGFPMCAITLCAYIFIGYPLIKVLLAAFGG